MFSAVPESWVKLKPVSPVLLPGANRCPPPASMAVRCGDMPKSENKKKILLYAWFCPFTENKAKKLCMPTRLGCSQRETLLLSHLWSCWRCWTGGTCVAAWRTTPCSSGLRSTSPAAPSSPFYSTSRRWAGGTRRCRKTARPPGSPAPGGRCPGPTAPRCTPRRRTAPTSPGRCRSPLRWWPGPCTDSLRTPGSAGCRERKWKCWSSCVHSSEPP